MWLAFDQEVDGIMVKEHIYTWGLAEAIGPDDEAENRSD